jgi:endonuclease/exonuclease/phosphatase family metal-dependent hydrolase
MRERLVTPAYHRAMGLNDPTEPTGPGGPASPESLRFLTLNIWANRPPWPERGRLIREGLRREAPDVVAMQEVLRPQGHGTSQADEIAHGLGYRVAFSRACHIEKPFPSEFGNALLSRFPLREHRTVPLPVPEELEPRSLLYALLSVRVGLLPVFVTHLTWEPQHQAVREQQLRFIRDYIEHELSLLPDRVPEHVRILPPVLMGDLNAVPESAEVRLLTEPAPGPDGQPAAEPHFVDAWRVAGGPGPGFTFAATNPYTAKHGQGINERIDYIFVGQPRGAARFRVRRAALCMDQPEGSVFPSDHYGVVAELSLDRDG